MPHTATPLLASARLRALESAHAAAQPPLMERAGRAAADFARHLLGGRDGAILIVCGPGNNGGDGFVMARELRAAGHVVHVVCATAPESLPADAQAAHASWLAAGGTVHDTLPVDVATQPWALTVDALFGIGLTRAPAGVYAEQIDALNALAAPCLALDLPSGLDGDRGAAFVPCVRADHTLSFIAAKPGLYTADGPDHAGAVRVADLGLADDIAAAGCDAQLVSPALFASRLHPRRRNSHKGTYGEAGIIGGATGMAGAALLAARAALKLGAGKVFVSVLDEGLPLLDVQQPELMLRPPADVLSQVSALAIGPGLGASSTAQALVHEAVATRLPLLLDADALNTVAATTALREALATRGAPTVLTPHPAEAARLLDSDAASVQADRLAAARELATRYRAHVVVKGCGSVIATPDGTPCINASGHAGLASAGTGDVLSGLCVALLAQHWPAREALLAAVHLHGAAADLLAANDYGPIGLTAGELADAARAVFNGWCQQR